MITTKKHYESGNVLFLILIAVALFAALSYAVTQSSRSGGSDASSETAAVNAGALTQYPTGVRTAMLRMSIAGIPVENIEFNEPANFAGCSTPSGGLTAGNCIFHPNGGGATFQDSPPSAMASASAGTWYFNKNFAFGDIGSSSADFATFLPGITEGLCKELNKRYSISAITIYVPTANSMTQSIGGGTGYVDTASNTTGSVTAIPNAVAWPVALNGHPYGCFNAGTAGSPNYVYYHTLIEN